MAKTTQKRIWILLVAVLILSGCGRKEAPQIIHDSQPPQLVDFRYELQGMIIKLDFKLTGSPEGVGFQVDRAEMDPYCKCPGLWRRFFEQQPSPKYNGVATTKFLGLQQETDYVFRIRAVDAAGQLGPWSKNIHATGVDIFKQ